MEEFFINCVRQHPCLWDTKLVSYKRLDVKDAAWKDILMKTNIESVTQAKLKWKNLRDTHREKLKKIIRTKNSQSKKHIKPWRYMRQMEFLLPHMTNAEPDANVTTHSDISTSSVETSNTRVSRGSAASITSPKKRKTNEIIHNVEDALVNFMKEMEDNREKLAAQRDELRKEVMTTDDPLKHFFDSMYHSTKQMPEFYQRTIKRSLFKLVMDAEENIANTNSYPTFCSNDYAHNSRPSTNQTNYSSGHASASPEPSNSDIKQIVIEEHSTHTQNEENQDSMLVVEISPGDGVLNQVLP